MDITIRINDKEAKLLRKRAKKNLLTLCEQVEDIVRRSCINSKKTSSISDSCDDRLVGIFSRKVRNKKLS